MYKSIKNYKRVQLFPSKDWKITSVANFKKLFPSINLLFFNNNDKIRYKKTSNNIEIAQRINNKWSITSFINIINKK